MIEYIQEFLGFSGALSVFQIFFTLAAFGVVWRWKLFPKTRKQSFVFGVVWVLLSTSEYWIFGPFSFTHFLSDYSFSFFKYLNDWHDGGVFSHAFAGGNDIFATSLVSGQLFSLDGMLLGMMPPWVAYMIHKVAGAATGYIGTYLICRRMAGSDRFIASGLAGLFILSSTIFGLYSWAYGLGYALIPLAVYLGVGRVGRRYYFAGVIAVAALHAISMTPTHSGLAFFPALALVALLFGFRHFFRTIPAMIIMVGFVMLNWHESLYAKALLGPYTYRGTSVSLAVSSFGEFLRELWFSIGQFGEVMVLAATGAVLLVAGGHRHWFRILAVGIISLLIGLLLRQIPWSLIGLSPLKGFNFNYIIYSFTIVGLIIFAIATRATPEDGSSWKKRRLGLIGAAVIAVAIGKFAWYKALDVSVWLSEGGLPMLTEGIDRLEARRWGADEPFRVVTIPYRIAANMAPAAGLDALDGSHNLVLLSSALFWSKGVVPKYEDIDSGYVRILPPDLDLKCCKDYDITSYVGLDFLRIANVGFILSTLPLHGGGIVKVAGPADNSAPTRNTEPLFSRLRGYLMLIRDPAPIYVYSVPDFLPRVFVAEKIIEVGREIPDEGFLKMVGNHALERTVVVRSDRLPKGAAADADLILDRFSSIRDGLDIRMRKGAANGGVIVVNLPYTPFWRAYADGHAVEVFPVNVIHMGVVVPPQTENLEVRYERPLLRQKLKGILVDG